MQMILIFDVDGTLTGQRRLIHEDFARFLRALVQSEIVYLVSGSTHQMLQKQIPDWLLKSVAGLFTCSGNSFYSNGERIYQNSHEFQDELVSFSQNLINQSAYGERTGAHIEFRSGAMNVSVVGRNASPLQRKEYEEYDLECGERQFMIEAIEKAFPEYEANHGGQISIDVSPKGWNKSIVFNEISKRHTKTPLFFFGDNIKQGGNDLPLARAVLNGGIQNKVFPVRDHFETWRILQQEFTPELRLVG